MNKKTDTSLRKQILVRTIPATLLLFLLISTWTFVSIVYNFSTEVYVSVNANADNFSKAANSRIREVVHANQALAKNDLVINAIIDVEHRKSTLQPFFRSLMLPGPDTQLVFMTNYRGVPFVSNDKAILENQDTDSGNGLNEIWEETVLKKGAGFVGVAKDKLIFATPVMYSNQPEAAIVSIYDLEEFFSEICENSETTITGFSHRGRVFVSADDQVLKTGAVLTVPAGWVSSSVPIRDLPEVTTIVFESEHTISSASQAVFIAMGCYLLLCSIMVVGSIWYATYIVTDPLAKLAARVKEVHETGDLSIRVREVGPSEFRSLSLGFNQMLAQLDKTTVSREAYRKLALVAKYTDNAVIITDEAGRIEWANDGFTRSTGYELDEVVGKTPGSILQGPESDPEIVELMRQAIAERRGFDVEIVNYDKRQNPYWVAIESRPIADENGGVEKFIAIQRDISERKRNEKEKEKLANELQDSARRAGMAEIATGVLHNVGNVLNSINVSVNLLIQSCQETKIGSLVKTSQVLEAHKDDLGHFLTSDERGKHFAQFFKILCDAIQNENKEDLIELKALAEHVNHVKETIAFQQSYAKQGGAVESVRLDVVIDNVLKMNADSFRTLDIQIERDLDGTVVNANKHKLLQILINLITNAKHALRDSKQSDRQLIVTVAEDSGFATISVRDNGIGISIENLNKIFVHGFTTKAEGHGFGLHSSALAAEEMGGSLNVSSDGLGQGAEFVLRIPLDENRGKMEQTIDDELVHQVGSVEIHG